MTRPIYDALKSDALDVIALTDRDRIKFLVTNLADQINASRASSDPPKRVIDLADHITDIVIETSAQGASLLEVHVSDPAWVLLQRDPAGVPFIDVDEQGYLWPPLEVNFPPAPTDSASHGHPMSDSVWRLCQLRAATEVDSANLILVFEDKIVAQLREHAGPEMSNPNETRAEFIRRIVKKASQNPLLKGDVGIRFVPLLPTAAFTAQDLASTEVTLPASAKQPDAPKARRNPNKKPGVTPTKRVPVADGQKWTDLAIGVGGPLVGTPAANPGSADYVPNSGFIPGLGNNP